MATTQVHRNRIGHLLLAALLTVPSVASAGDDHGGQYEHTVRLYVAPVANHGDSAFRETVFRHFVGATRHRETVDLDSGMVVGLDLERRFGRRFGLAGGIAVGSIDADYGLETTEFRSFPPPTEEVTVAQESLRLLAVTLGPTIHLALKSRADWYVHPVLSLVDLGDRHFVDQGAIGEFEGKSDLTSGLIAGVDVPLERKPRWGLHLSLRWTRGSELDDRLGLDLDSILIAAGLCYDY